MAKLILFAATIELFNRQPEAYADPPTTYASD